MSRYIYYGEFNIQLYNNSNNDNKFVITKSLIKECFFFKYYNVLKSKIFSYICRVYILSKHETYFLFMRTSFWRL